MGIHISANINGEGRMEGVTSGTLEPENTESGLLNITSPTIVPDTTLYPFNAVRSEIAWPKAYMHQRCMTGHMICNRTASK